MFLISLLLLFAFGYLTVATLLPISQPGERLTASLPFGMGLTTLLIWSLLALGAPLSQGLVIFLQTLLMGGLLYRAYHKGNLNIRLPRLSLKEIKLDFRWVLILLLFGIGLVFNFFYPVMVSDGVGYKVMGKLMVGEQKILVHENWFPFGSQNRTLGFHLIFGYFYLFGFNHPKIVQSIYYISLLGLFHISIRRFISSTAAKGFTLLLATSPMVFWHSFLYLNNLSAGFYFFCGLLYWFHFLNSKDARYLPISSFAFMLAAWIRYEVIVFYFLTLAITYYWVLKNRQLKAAGRLLSFPLAFSCLWALYSMIYFPEMSRTLNYLTIALFLLGTALIFLLMYVKQVKTKTCFQILLLFVVATLVFGLLTPIPTGKIDRIYHAFLSKLTWITLSQFSWGLGSLLFLLTPFYYVSFSRPQKHLFFNLTGTVLLIALFVAIVQQGSRLLYSSVIDKMVFFLHSPGKIINSTTPREIFAIFPSLLFLVGTSMRTQENSSKTIKFFNRALFKYPLFNLLNFLIMGNLLIVSYFFLYPRFELLTNHVGDSGEKILLSSGPRDNLNFFKTTYKITYAIARLTPPQSTILMPYHMALAKEAPHYLGVFATIDVLYPRRVYWGKGHGVQQKRPPPVGNVFRVTHPNWQDNQCKDHPEGKSLGYPDWYLCPANGKTDL